MHIPDASKLAALIAASVLSLSSLAYAADNNAGKDPGKDASKSANATNSKSDPSLSNENNCAAGSTTDANGKCTTETKAK